MKALKVNIAGIELIVPEENEGMLDVRGITYEIIEIDTIPNIMEDLIAKLN
jgi:hypothetical protein